MIAPKEKRMVPRAQELRADMTMQERKLWYMFLRKSSVKWYRQRVIKCFVADFYCASAKLVIEVDGVQHYTEQGLKYDAERTAILESYGLKVLRFTNDEIEYQFGETCKTIQRAIEARITPR